MPYTRSEEHTLKALVEEYGKLKGHDVFNRMRAAGKMGQGSKDRMMRRSAEARRTGRTHEA